MMSEVQKTLVRARAMIAQGWTQFTPARNPKTKRPVAVTSPLAGQWCAMGAIDAAAPTRDARWTAMETLADHVPNNRPITFNDAPGRTQEQILEAFDAAIKAAR